jgi:hypothetical protein
MLAVFIRNNRIIQNAGLSFAALGTTMHMLNVASLMTPSLSHTWSAIAIVGFFMTASSQIRKGMIGKIPLVNRKRNNHRSENARNDVSLP